MHGIAADLFWRVLDRCSLGEGANRALGRVVGGRPGAADDSVDRRDVDDRAAAGCPHRRYGVLGAQEHTGRVDNVRSVPGIQRSIFDLDPGFRDRHPRIVQRDIQAAISLKRGRDRIDPLLFIADIQMQENRLPAIIFDLIDHPYSEIIINVRDHDTACTRPGEQATAGRPDAGSTPCYQGHLVFQSHACFSVRKPPDPGSNSGPQTTQEPA